MLVILITKDLKYFIFTLLQLVISLLEYSFFTFPSFSVGNKLIVLSFKLDYRLYFFSLFLLIIFYIFCLGIKTIERLILAKYIFLVLCLFFVVLFGFLNTNFVSFSFFENKIGKLKVKEDIYKNILTNKKVYLFVSGNYSHKECVKWEYYLSPNFKIRENFSFLIDNNSVRCFSFKNLSKSKYFLIYIDKRSCFILR